MILINSSPKNALKIFQPFLPIYVPVGIGSLLAVARREGISANFIDEQFEDDMVAKAAKFAAEMDKPYIFGFSVLTIAFKNAIDIATRLKKIYPDSVVIFGGIHPTSMSEEVLAYPCVDIVVRGEGEKTLVELYRRIKQKIDFSGLDNISYRRDGRIIHNRTNFSNENLDNYPPFPYDLFDMRRYDLGFVISSRGCPYECIFCSNRVTTGRRYRFRSASPIVEELDMLYNKYNKRYVLFVDDNLLVNKERVYDIIANIKARGLHKKMTFNCQARGDNVNPKLLKDLYDSGFRSIFFGIETSSDRIMSVIKKNETVAQCAEATKMAKAAGFHVSATFIYGLPTETYEDRMACIKLSKELRLDMVRYNNATPYPGTELYEIARKDGRLRVEGLYENFVSVSTFIENPFKKTPFSYVPEGNTEDQIRRDMLFSYFSFYLDLNKLKQIFFRPDQGVGWFDLGESFKNVVKKFPGLVILGFMLGFKFCQLFYYMVIKKKTALTFKHFMKVFSWR